MAYHNVFGTFCPKLSEDEAEANRLVCIQLDQWLGAPVN